MLKLDHIRNFSIIAHIDHGKSTLSDRMLELTHTIEKRKMREQVLDSMELERERGITIKMQPVRMAYNVGGDEYLLNLIDTPGHIDFSYEVSRAIRAVEGAILLVDATKGVQAQTLSVLSMARESGLTILPVINKIDLPAANVDAVKDDLVKILECPREDIIEVSGKTGEGVEKLMEEIVKKLPSPKVLDDEIVENDSCSLVFDFEYSTHKGIIVYIRVLGGTIKKGENLMFRGLSQKFVALEIGTFSPEKKVADQLTSGEIGYIVTGIKETSRATVGDTITGPFSKLPPLSGYMQPKPVVWASIYPEDQNTFPILRQALERLRLADSSLAFEEELSGPLGRGFKCGFLGMLHLEIITERLRREYNLSLIVAIPTVSFEVELLGGKKETIYSASQFPDDSNIKIVYEPWVSADIIMPSRYLGDVTQLLHVHEAEVLDIQTFGDRNVVKILMPLRELMRNFFDELKSISSGFASLSYKLEGMKKADVTRLDILIADERIPELSKIIPRRRVDHESNEMVDRLKANLPRQMFDFKIQAKSQGRIVASRAMAGMKKDVTDYLYGGDITRKMKLREKQKKGKKRMKKTGKVNITQDLFLKIMKSDQRN
ncbi:MAG: translation elongation factor 4 [Candidatus Paceibacterota bacterium]|jgi:GTP-binding protein LepA